MAGIDDDDPTPRPPPIDPQNAELFSALCDLRLALEHHSVRLGILAREIRLAARAVGPELRGRVADEIDNYNRESAALAARIRGVG